MSVDKDSSGSNVKEPSDNLFESNKIKISEIIYYASEIHCYKGACKDLKSGNPAHHAACQALMSKGRVSNTPACRGFRS